MWITSLKSYTTTTCRIRPGRASGFVIHNNHPNDESTIIQTDNDRSINWIMASRQVPMSVSVCDDVDNKDRHVSD